MRERSRPDAAREPDPAATACLRAAGRVVIVTGAGMSAESGVPTFREASRGLWARFSPEELASREGFLAAPARVWEWYAWRRGLVAQAEPNPGHCALAALEHRVPNLTIVTQNVDGLHQRSGSRRVIELHGNLARTRCFSEDTVVESWGDTGEVPPRCPRCGGWLRPDVVWFGEALPLDAWQAAEAAIASCDLCLVVGTSAVVYPAAFLLDQALDAGAKVLEINPDETPFTPRATWNLRGRAGELLPRLVAGAFPEPG